MCQTHTMGEITVVPATAERWPDVEHALTGGGDGPSCWCQWFLMPGRTFSASSRDTLKDSLHAEITSAPRAPGLLASVDGTPAGWCRVGPRPEQSRLARSRIVRSAGATPLDDTRVWALTCFVVRREFRRTGVAHRLAVGAVEFARTGGATLLEAYPVDERVRTHATSNELVHGTVGILASAGFQEVAHPTPGRAVMSVDLRAGRGPALSPTSR